MKQGFCLTLLGLAASAAAGSAMAQPLAPMRTAKPVETFAQCFVGTQERAGHVWAFVPKDSGGGTFSNVGAAGIRQPYFLDVADRGATRELRLSSAGTDPSLVLAVQHCA